MVHPHHLRPAAALVAALVALVAAAAATGAQDPFKGARDSAVGAGTYGNGCTILVPPDRNPFCITQVRQFSFDATSDPLGGSASGSFSTTTAPGRTYTGTVTCLNVQGNTASFGGTFTSTPDEVNVPPGTPFVVYVVDNAAADPAAPDLISPLVVLPPGDPDLVTVPPDFPATCPPPASPYGYFPVTSGDIAVTDSSCGEVKINPNDKLKCKHPSAP